MEDLMKKTAAFLLIGTVAMAAARPAIAHDTEIGYPSRGECEAASAGESNAEKNWLVATFPDLFDTTGEAASFLTKAWTCDKNPADGLYYITDHLQEVLDSDWFAQRNH